MDLKTHVLDLNRRQSEKFCSPAAQLALDMHRSEYPPMILSFECMDGRVDFPGSANLPIGAVERYRHIGGQFELGSDNLRSLVWDAVRRAIALSRPRRVIVVCTYHFSRGSADRGCAGHKNNTEAAKAGAIMLKKQFERVFGVSNGVVFPIVIGIETDEDGFIFHGESGTILQISEYVDESKIISDISALYFGFDPVVLKTVVRIATGNMGHIGEVRASGRDDSDFSHSEGMIFVGRGFGWFQERKQGALIIGPYDDDLIRAVGVAGSIVLSNIKKGRTGVERALLLTSSPYFSPGYDEAMAKENSAYLMRVATKAIRDAVSDLPFEQLCCVTEMQTRLLHEISPD